MIHPRQINSSSPCVERAWTILSLPVIGKGIELGGYMPGIMLGSQFMPSIFETFPTRITPHLGPSARRDTRDVVKVVQCVRLWQWHRGPAVKTSVNKRTRVLQ